MLILHFFLTATNNPAHINQYSMKHVKLLFKECDVNVLILTVCRIQTKHPDLVFHQHSHRFPVNWIRLTLSMTSL